MASLTLEALKKKITSEIESLHSPTDSPGVGRILQADVPRYRELQSEFRMVQDWIEDEDTLSPLPEWLR
jgi:hypothetical protein